MIPRYYINKIGISTVNLSSAIETIKDSLSGGNINYICVTNSRTCYIANHNKDYCSIQNNSLLTVPDGMPIVWVAHMKGFDKVGRVTGADLLKEMLLISEENNYSHYFYGSTSHTIRLIEEKLRKEYPDIDIKGMVSPPFQPVEKFDVQQIANEINQLKPTFFWCGLGAPKQEILISLLQPRLKATICIGIGLAFEYYAGVVERVPLWLRSIGMEWLFRCFQQPVKSRRFIIPFFSMLFFLAKCFILKPFRNSLPKSS